MLIVATTNTLVYRKLFSHLHSVEKSMHNQKRTLSDSMKVTESFDNLKTTKKGKSTQREREGNIFMNVLSIDF